MQNPGDMSRWFLFEHGCGTKFVFDSETFLSAKKLFFTCPGCHEQFQAEQLLDFLGRYRGLTDALSKEELTLREVKLEDLNL